MPVQFEESEFARKVGNILSHYCETVTISEVPFFEHQLTTCIMSMQNPVGYFWTNFEVEVLSIELAFPGK